MFDSTDELKARYMELMNAFLPARGKRWVKVAIPLTVHTLLSVFAESQDMSLREATGFLLQLGLMKATEPEFKRHMTRIDQTFRRGSS